MAKLIIQLVADFLRDTPTAANQYGEALRCAVLDNEVNALTAYGLTQNQIDILVLNRNRETIMKAISDEIGAIMDEIEWPIGGMALAYPQGAVHFREVKLLFSNANVRTIMVRGSGLEGPSVEFTPKGGGGATAGNILSRSCEKDAWQRLYVSVTLPAGTYTVRVKRSNGAHGDRELVVP